MLLKVEYHGLRKYLKLQPGFSYGSFIEEVKNKFGIPLSIELLFLDDSDTVVDEEVIHDILEANPNICLLAKDFEEFTPTGSSTPNSSRDAQSLDVEMSSLSQAHQSSVAEGAHTFAADDAAEMAKKIVQEALEKNAGGEDVIEEYRRSKTLTHNTRRHLVNILVSHMVEKHGIPVRMQREKYGLGIVTLFPNLRDPFSTKGYEHFYDGASGTGYLAWRLKTVQRKVTKRSENSPQGALQGGPSLKRSFTAEQQADGDAVREAISLLLHSSDDSVIRSKMRETFQHRHQLVHNPEMTTEVLKMYPRFLDVKGLVRVSANMCT
ncbi:uncharacterized protein LOC132445460 isoform X2 [Gadus macrocephalus]|uniref:uncharacterized protein LOC132445460 isoform X2 n=1 Tax=Gadus macrocephalus TaxID=80720 RepID=UPI0028CB2E51|nr:uncharacterized protein LOC132445460 isoform X2 [Gadus macrocephalus]